MGKTTHWGYLSPIMKITPNNRKSKFLSFNSYHFHFQIRSSKSLISGNLYLIPDATRGICMKLKRYIVWSTDKDIDLNTPRQRRWYIEQVLSHGLTEDIASLDWDEIKILLPELKLPEEISRLWRHYFTHA